MQMFRDAGPDDLRQGDICTYGGDGEWFEFHQWQVHSGLLGAVMTQIPDDEHEDGDIHWEPYCQMSNLKVWHLDS